MPITYQDIIEEEGAGLLNYSFPFRMNIRRKVEHVVNMVHARLNDDPLFNEHMFTLADITSVMDHLITSDASLKKQQVNIFTITQHQFN